ncbi:unnamed protein product [Thelazia callipaeda]|uniref:Reverse transcriptase domain-containing protein n=1 Tax=Thelazia callipaeda TaxID=103827 RepID=A0A0N5CRR1_THECL|nr:unnamed protein product [Thelazia callipaeda]
MCGTCHAVGCCNEKATCRVNRLRTVIQVQGPKKQALLSLAVCRKQDNQLYTTWYDIEKAFDSVNHEYLLSALKVLACHRGSSASKVEVFDVIELEMNPEKSATNTEVCANKTALLEGTQRYKYLEIMGRKSCAPTGESYDI